MKILRVISAAFVIFGFAFFETLKRPFFSPLYRGPKSDHFDGKRFQNLSGRKRSTREFFKWLFFRKPLPWPKEKVKIPTVVPKKQVNDTIELTYVNHATVLIQSCGWNILTDPIWSERCSPFNWTGPRRKHNPGVNFEDLPSIDLILISHNHYDHLDLSTLKKLYQKDQPLIITGLGNQEYLNRKGFENVEQLDWWKERLIQEIQVIYVPSEHFSARGIMDRDETLWGGFIIKAPQGIIYFAGDTGYGKHFLEIKRRYGSPDLALLPIGAYLPRWFMRSVHMSPDDALRAHNDLEAKVSLPIHFGTFHLSDESIDDPVRALEKQRKKLGIAEEVFPVWKPASIFSVKGVVDLFRGNTG